MKEITETARLFLTIIQDARADKATS